MLTISPIFAFTDNYIWAIINDKTNEVIIVDAGQAKPVLDFVKNQNLSISQIWVTHHHNDHIGGIAELAEKFPNAQIFAHADVLPQIGLKNSAQGTFQQSIAVGENSELSAWGNAVQVWQVPGHTENHLAYLLTLDDNLHVFCGDTLFRAGCGRVFTGTMVQLFESFDRFNDLHDENALFYPAHEYTLSNLKFAEFIEPNNPHIQTAIYQAEQCRQNNQPTLPTTLADERLINPFLKIIANPDDDSLIQGVNSRKPLESDDPFVVFKTLRELKNNF